MVVVVAAASISLNLRIILGRMLLESCLGLHLSVGIIDVVLCRGYLREIIVYFNVRRHGGWLADRLRLWIPREGSDLKGRQLLLPTLRLSAYVLLGKKK